MKNLETSYYDEEGPNPSFSFIHQTASRGLDATKFFAMKKLLFSLVLCLLTVSASAQVKSVDAKFGLRSESGLAVGITAGIGENFEIAPAINFFFPSAGNMFVADVDLHYLLPKITEQLDLYPIVGVGYFHYGFDKADIKVSENQASFNIGFGARYCIADHWAVFAEEKIQIINGYNSNFLSLGISYRF